MNNYLRAGVSWAAHRSAVNGASACSPARWVSNARGVSPTRLAMTDGRLSSTMVGMPCMRPAVGLLLLVGCTASRPPGATAQPQPGAYPAANSAPQATTVSPEPAPFATPPPPASQPTSVAPVSSPNQGLREYVRCGCGCCSGDARPAPRCVSTEGELRAIAADDAQARNNPQCAVMGCSLGTRYVLCQ